ncbi:MAG: hypothetical protein JW807_16515 [Spirochaetes bacterium]|nr:hypothetical protein [Spirochaetota bacterium]
MDVRLINSFSYSALRSVDANDSFVSNPIASGKPDIPYAYPKEENVSEQVREQVMMNLEEVQNFLYMMIGSKLRIQSDQNSVGSSVNTAV